MFSVCVFSDVSKVFKNRVFGYTILKPVDRNWNKYSLHLPTIFFGGLILLFFFKYLVPNLSLNCVHIFTGNSECSARQAWTRWVVGVTWNTPENVIHQNLLTKETPTVVCISELIYVYIFFKISSATSKRNRNFFQLRLLTIAMLSFYQNKKFVEIL